MSENIEKERRWRFAPIQFCLTALLYGTALIASGGATFGPFGFIVGTVLLTLWMIVFWFEPISYGLTVVLGLGCGILLLSCITSIPGSGSRPPGVRTQCANNLKQFGLALSNYHDTYGQFPPTFVADLDGKRMHSWRTLILPFSEEVARYQKYDFTEPWNGPNNVLLHSPIPVYQKCPEDIPIFAGETSYVAVCGQGPTWTSQNGRKDSDLSNGLSLSVLVIEANHSGIHWMEPRDFSVEDAIKELSDPDYGGHDGHRPNDYFVECSIGGHNVLMADGSVHFLPIMSEEVARDFLLNGKLPASKNSVTHNRHNRTRYDNIAKLAIFVVLALLPFYWFVVRLERERAARDLNDGIG